MLKEYAYHKRQVIVSVDGVEHFNSRKVHCSDCTTKTLRDGSVSYSHAALAAVIVHPAHKEVLPIDFEPIVCQDGSAKNACERTAAKRLCQSVKEKSPALEILLVEDALYANAPHIRQIIKEYSGQSGIKKRVYPHLFRHQIITYLTRKGIISPKLQLLSGLAEEKSLAIYRDLALADVAEEYESAREQFPVK